MGQQRHVIKRQTVEITLANKEAAWFTQQTSSRLFQQYLPTILDRCLSEASNPDCLYRIDCLELDLGELDSNQLETEILEKIDATLRQALQEHIGNTQAEPIARQQDEKLMPICNYSSTLCERDICPGGLITRKTTRLKKV